MLCVNAKNADIDRLMTEAEYEPVTLVGEGGKNAVLISEDEWRGMQETLYLNSIPGLAESIIEGGKTPLEECVDYHPGEEW